MKPHPSLPRRVLAWLGVSLLGLTQLQLLGQTGQTRLDSPTEPFASFGYAVAVDGNTAAVGAPNEMDGAVYVHRRDATGAWLVEARLTPVEPVPGMSFGSALALSGDTLAVGAQWDSTAGDRAGSVLVFVREGSTWRQQAKLVPGDLAPLDGFGTSVALDGDTLVVGAPFSDAGGFESGAVYVFRRSGESWAQTDQLLGPEPRFGNIFGFSVALQSNRLAVGVPYDDENELLDSGSVVLYEQSGSGWIETATLTSSAAGGDANLGWSVSLSGDTVVAGAPYQAAGGAAYVFHRDSGSASWNCVGELMPGGIMPYALAGFSVAIDGDLIAVGTPSDSSLDSNAGSVTWFEWSGTQWTERAKLGSSDIEPFEQFGWSVGFRGSVCVVGAPAKGDLDEGAAYVLQVPRNEPPVAHAQELTLPEDTSLGLTLTGTHPKGGTLAFTLVQSPVHGTLSGHPPELVYTPNPNFFGSDSLTFTVNDGVLDSAPAVVTLRVSPINDPPTLTGIADLTLPADSGPTTIPFSVADIDDDAASLVVGAVASEPALFPEGSVVVAGTGAQRTVTLQPAAGASGSAVILLAVADAFETATTQFTVTVVPPPRQNQPPVAVARATPDPVISINGRDGLVHLNGGKSEDPDGDELSYRWFVDDQAAPVLESAAGVVTLPLGMHTVRLEVSDGQSQSVASLRVQVISVTQAVQKLAGEVRRAELSRGRRTALLAILSGASRSFDRQHNDAGVRQLRLFQMMVNAREGHPIDRETAARLTRLAQRIIDAVNGR